MLWTLMQRFGRPLTAFVGCFLLSCAVAHGDDDLKGDTNEEDGLRITPIELHHKDKMLRCLLWANKAGSSFFALNSDGELKLISVPDFKVLKTKDFERKLAWMSMSAEGLLLTAPDPQEIWVVDPESLAIKKKIEVPNLTRAASAPGLSVAFACDKDYYNRKLYIADLKKGKVVKFALPPDTPRGIGFANPQVSPDGRFLFTNGPTGRLERFAFKDGKLKLQESSPQLSANGEHNIQISSDSKLVCCPVGTGNGNGTKSYSTIVYPTSSFKKFECVLETGGYPSAVGFDPAGGYIYAQNNHSALLVYTLTGVKKREYKGEGGGAIRQYLVHPAGNKVLVLTNRKLYFIEVPPKKGG
jgi:hypothetical protein